MTLGHRHQPPLAPSPDDAGPDAPDAGAGTTAAEPQALSLALRASGAADLTRRFGLWSLPAAAVGGTLAALAAQAADLSLLPVLGAAALGTAAGVTGLYAAYVAPRLQRLPRWRMTWGFHVIELRDPAGRATAFDLRRPHRAFVLRSPERGRLLVRLEQPAADLGTADGALPPRGEVHRVDLVAPIPDRCRCSAQADLRGGRDLRRCVSSRQGAVARAPLEVTTRGAATLAAVDALIDLLEAHRDARTLSPRLELAHEAVEVLDDGFAVARDGQVHHYRLDGVREVACKGRQVGHAPGHHGHATRVFVALIPSAARVPPLVFTLNGPTSLQGALASEWERSDPGLDARAVHLDLATPESLLVAQALRRFFRGRDADHPVARLLDYA